MTHQYHIRLFWAVLGVMLWTSALAAVPSSAVSMADSVLKSVLDGKRPAEDLTLVYESGRRYVDGHITLTLSGDRTVKLVFTKDGQEKNYQGALSRDGLSTLIKTMRDDKFWTAPPAPELKVFDAAVISIRLSTKQNDLNVQLTCLESEALQSRELQTLVLILRGIIATVSRGEVQDH